MYTNSHVEEKKLSCVVCGSVARGFNFGARTCMSCKVFFRRNAFTCLSNLSCPDGGHCKVTEKTRKNCTYCRLLRCFRVGMRRELFRLKENNYFNQMEIGKQQYRKQSRLVSHSYQIVPNNKHISTDSMVSMDTSK
jgi:hypothetical protein